MNSSTKHLWESIETLIDDIFDLNFVDQFRTSIMQWREFLRKKFDDIKRSECHDENFNKLKMAIGVGTVKPYLET